MKFLSLSTIACRGLLLMTLLLLPSGNTAQEYYDDYAQEQENYAPQPADNLYHDYAARHEAGK